MVPGSGMGFSFYIGEASVKSSDDSTEIWIDVDIVEIEEAPAFGEALSDHVNRRCPSYSGWTAFVGDTGLHDMFLDGDTGLIRTHPGAARILPCHLDEVRKALDRYRSKHPDIQPVRRSAKTDPLPAHAEWSLEYGNMVRLIWLEYWISWALANCKVPTFKNG